MRVAEALHRGRCNKKYWHKWSRKCFNSRIMSTATETSSKLRVMYSRQQIAERVAEIGAQISKDYAGEKVLLVGVLKGACLFLSDLARTISLDCSFDFIS